MSLFCLLYFYRFCLKTAIDVASLSFYAYKLCCYSVTNCTTVFSSAWCVVFCFGKFFVSKLRLLTYFKPLICVPTAVLFCFYAAFIQLLNLSSAAYAFIVCKYKLLTYLLAHRQTTFDQLIWKALAHELKLRLMLQRTWRCWDRHFRAVLIGRPWLRWPLTTIPLRSRSRVQGLHRQIRGGQWTSVQRWTWLASVSPTPTTCNLVRFVKRRFRSPCVINYDISPPARPAVSDRRFDNNSDMLVSLSLGLHVIVSEPGRRYPLKHCIESRGGSEISD